MMKQLPKPVWFSPGQECLLATAVSVASHLGLFGLAVCKLWSQTVKECVICGGMCGFGLGVHNYSINCFSWYSKYNDVMQLSLFVFKLCKQPSDVIVLPNYILLHSDSSVRVYPLCYIYIYTCTLCLLSVAVIVMCNLGLLGHHVLPQQLPAGVPPFISVICSSTFINSSKNNSL